MGININDASQDFTGHILRGEKTIETRKTRSLDPYIGERVGIVRTGVGPATLVGYATVGEPVVYDSVSKFRRDYDKHLVAPGSDFDIKDGLKYGYPLMQVEEITPQRVQSRGIIARKINPYTRPDLRERLKRKIMAGSRGGRPGEWSARKAQLLAAEYEKAGGGYTGSRSKAQRSLSRWTKQDWRTKSGKPSLETGERYLPAAAIKALSSAEYAESTRTKRKTSGQFSKQPKRIAMKTKRYRNPRNPQTDTPEFKRWFGKSKVVDANGDPLVVYHGTTADFSEFSPEFAPDRGGILAFFSESPKFASEYASQGGDSNVIPVYLKIERPFDYRKHAWLAEAFWDDTGGITDEYAINRMVEEPEDLNKDKFVELVKDGAWGAIEAEEFVQYIRDSRYDGIVLTEGGAVNYAVFSPTQIKSAYGNRGTFDPMDPDITNPMTSTVRKKLAPVIEPDDRILCYDTASGEDFYRLWDIIHTGMPMTEEALVEVEGMLDDDGVLVIESGETPPGLQEHFRKATRYNGLLLVQGPKNPEQARIETEKLRRDLE